MPMDSKSSSRKETPFERKLREIEREKRRVREEIKALSRAVKRGQAPVAGKVGPTVRSSVSGTVSVGDGDDGDAGTPSDLFGWSASAAAAKEGLGRTESATSAKPGGIKRAPVQGDQRFASYFATGGFKTPIQTRQGRGVQRNKLVFIGVVAVVLIYIIVYAVFR